MQLGALSEADEVHEDLFEQVRYVIACRALM